MEKIISIVCPFYNEENILAKAIERMALNAGRLQHKWELIVVDDGSVDDSLDIAKTITAVDSRIHVVSYARNRGRGHALKKGIEAAKGDIIITTEIDCSWGDDILAALVDALESNQSLDIVIASTNLEGSGYEKVPKNRVFFSRLGNWLFRLAISKDLTMFTGMTRAYRAAAIKGLPITENGKEFHLDVVVKALAFDLNIAEIPAKITWETKAISSDKKKKRKSSSKVRKLIKTHLLFAAGGRPSHYLFKISLALFFLTTAILVWSTVNYFSGEVSIHLLVLSGVSGVLTLLLLGFSIIALQLSSVLKEVWLLRKELKDGKV